MILGAGILATEQAAWQPSASPAARSGVLFVVCDFTVHSVDSSHTLSLSLVSAALPSSLPRSVVL